MSYIEPGLNSSKFTCPSCNTVAMQRWSEMYLIMHGINNNQTFTLNGYRISRCDACAAPGLWKDSKLTYPASRMTIEPNPDMPDSVRQDFTEALGVYSSSPKASAALLRLAVQHCCIELGLKGQNLNFDVGELVKRGLPEQVRQSLDIVRVVGNNAVHPGTIDVNDNPGIAQTLFKLVNLIVEYLISNPKRIGELFDSLPPGAKDQIERRDNTKDVADA